MDVETIESAVSHLGLNVLGGFHGDEASEPSEASEASEPATIVLIGNAGPAMWAALRGCRPSWVGSFRRTPC